MQLALPALIQSIDDLDTRQHLYDQQRKLLQKCTTDMMAAFIKAAKEYMCQTQKLFDRATQTMWQDERILPLSQRFSPTMLDLLDQRFINVTEKAQCIYDYKRYRFFGSTSTKN